MRIHWVETAELRAGTGHGVDFFVSDDTAESVPFAVLRGFEWLHDPPETVEIAIRTTDDSSDALFLASAKSSIEHWVNHPELLRAHADPSPAVRAVVCT